MWICTALLTATMGFAQACTAAYLGIELHDLTPGRASSLRLQEARGAEVVMVDQDSPAGKAGLREHDVIVSFDGRKIEDTQELRQLLRQTPPGRSVTLGISRDGQAMNVGVTLTSRQQLLAACRPNRILHIPEIHIPAIDLDLPQFGMMPLSGHSGLLVEDLTPQLGEFFGVPKGEGVLVRAVEPGSPAESAGVKAGDVIVRVNSAPITSVEDWRHLFDEPQGGPITLGIIRARREQTLSMNLPEAKAGAAPGLEIPNLGPDMDKLRDELRRLGPELQRSIAAEQARAAREVQRAMREMQRELQEEQRERQQELRDRTEESQ
jgi:predicted metalloprotease with PDZ domain